MPVDRRISIGKCIQIRTGYDTSDIHSNAVSWGISTMKCKLCWPFTVLRKHITGMRCIADRPEVDAKFRRWRDAQLNDGYLIRNDPQREALVAASELQNSDAKAALSRFLALAEGGSVWSMIHIGVAYGRGSDGASKNHTEAERWLRLAAEHGSCRARIYLANLYVMQSDFAAGEKVLQPCLAEGLAPAMYTMARVKLKQRPRTAERSEEARVLLEQASALGDLGAQWDLSRYMVRGRFGWHRIRQGFQLGLDACKKTQILMDGNGDKHREDAATQSS